MRTDCRFAGAYKLELFLEKWLPGGDQVFSHQPCRVRSRGASADTAARSLGRARSSPSAGRTTNPPMDAANLAEGFNGPQAVIVLAATALTAFFFLAWYSYDPEAAVDYSIEPPEQCLPGWKGGVLDAPSLKVCCPLTSLMAL